MGKLRKLCYLVLVIGCLLTGNSISAEPVSYLVINEVMSSNSVTIKDADGDYSDWIELYNPTGESIDLSGYYLSDSGKNRKKWQFPLGTEIASYDYLLIWASGKDRIDSNGQIHTNFSIAKDGETLILSKQDGITLVDYFVVPALTADVSVGRQPDASDNLVFFAAANTSPGHTNNKSMEHRPADRRLNPSFSHPGGFYQTEFFLELSAASAEHRIYYTLDGSVPDPIYNANRTILYQNPIPITSQVTPPGQSRSILKGVTPTPPLTYLVSSYTKWWIPKTPMFRGTVIRARAYAPDYTPSEVITHTFFVDPTGFKRHTFPIIAITVDPLDFYHYERGIYIPGIGYHEKLPWAYHFWGSGNFHGRGKEWERPIHIEFWEVDGSLAFAQNAGVRIHGDASRAHAQKSLRIIASSDYDEVDRFYHELFPGRTKPITGEPYNEYKSFILRNGGNTWEFTMFKDGLLQNLVAHTKLDVQYFRPAIVYLNGEYWGIHNIRDRYDEWYLYYTYGVDPKQVEMIKDSVVENEGSTPLADPSRANYRRILQLIDPNYRQNGYQTVNTLSNPQAYQQLQQLMSVDNFLDYAVIQIYIQNFDWPGNNVRYWRLNTEQYIADAPYGHDGLWRWMLFDLDLAFSDFNFNNLVSATLPAGREWYNQSWATFLLRSLMENEQFRIDFINRTADHLNTTFLPEVVITEVDRLEQLMLPEMEEHILRWNKPAPSVAVWLGQNEQLRNFARRRPAVQRQHILDLFNLSGTVEVTLKTDARMGTIKINSIEIAPGTPGVLDPSSWTGIYFQDVPLTLTALPKPGYQFVGWQGVPESERNKPTIILTPSSHPLLITAVFNELK
ncbi:MAG: hypothetical protein GX208_06780 [Firmicutes bacterium]|nr:hypothetical protein [Bacillota bacterium]